jgi:hypothetical protein
MNEKAENAFDSSGRPYKSTFHGKSRLVLRMITIAYQDSDRDSCFVCIVLQLPMSYKMILPVYAQRDEHLLRSLICGYVLRQKRMVTPMGIK